LQQLTHKTAALLLSSVFLFFINPDQLNWGGKVMFLFIGAEIFILLGLFFAQPEIKNRTYGDIDVLYASKVPARKFSEYIVEDGVVMKKGSRE
jgi:SP family general alpha glucoside:H+ symporter-like MFS transporter